MSKEIPIVWTKDLRIKSRDGVKTATRRLIKPQPHSSWTRKIEQGQYTDKNIKGSILDMPLRTPYKVGDILLAQEPYQVKEKIVFPLHFEIVYLDDMKRADCTISRAEYDKWCKRKFPYRNTSARFMYKSLCRYKYLVTGVGVERLQDIDELDALAEGVDGEEIVHGKLNGVEGDYIQGSCRNGFKNLWDSIYPEHGWDKNEWIIKLTYERIL